MKGCMELKGARVQPSDEPSEKIIIKAAHGAEGLEIDCGNIVEAQIWTNIIEQNIEYTRALAAGTSEDTLRYSTTKRYS